MLTEKSSTRRSSCRVLSLLFSIIFISFSSNLLGQTGSISGVAQDASTSEYLIGVNVFIPNLNTGSSTDLDGHYTIKNIPEGTYNLVIRYVGYKQLTESVIVRSNQITELNFSMEQTAIQLEELVVTGQGVATERRKLTSTVETINADEIRNAPVETVDQLLQGRVPGLSSFNSSGMPGTSGRVAARGLKSALSNATPVVYVDNVRVDNQDAFRLALDTGGAESSSLADLVIGEIDKIEVIKGGAASTLFGSDAANGVIQIFTKKGVPGIARWKVNVTSGYDLANTKFVTEDYIKNNVFQDGLYQAYSFDVSGGEKNFTYNLGGKTYMNDGVFVDNVSRSKNYSFNGGFRALLSELTTLEMSTSYTKSQYNRTNNNNLPTAPYGGFEDGGYGDHLGYTDRDRDSVLAIMLTDDISDDIDRFRTALNLDYKPIENFNNRFTFGLDYRKNEEREFVPKKSGTFFFQENGYVYRADREYLSVTLAYAGSYILP
ncbi:MAG: TonB-dependent receptor, partial [Melioribacteraceae bacterium]|nr:TonB-dependent receptor [Melioribacteraceae bacterium]